jgi:hypothetical protein
MHYEVPGAGYYDKAHNDADKQANTELIRQLLYFNLGHPRGNALWVLLGNDFVLHPLGRDGLRDATNLLLGRAPRNMACGWVLRMLYRLLTVRVSSFLRNMLWTLRQYSKL